MKETIKPNNLYYNRLLVKGLVVEGSLLLTMSHGKQRGVAGGDGELGCQCGKAGTSHVCDGSAHSSRCVVNGSNATAAFCYNEGSE